LLRGVNVGKHNRIAMADLRRVLEGVGARDVTTYLQSGNAVVTTEDPDLAGRVERALRDEVGLSVRVLTRTAEQLRSVVDRNPFPHKVSEPKLLHVAFLDAKPKAAVVKDLAKEDVAPEAFVVSGREIYSWHPNGLGRSELGALLSDKRLGVASTRRNWNTVTKLLAMADE
jgi:uncharacterized protein (DUF1697 family)